MRTPGHYVGVTLTTGNTPGLDRRINGLTEVFYGRSDVEDQGVGLSLRTAHVGFSATVDALTVEAATEKLQAIALCVLADAGENPSAWQVRPVRGDHAQQSAVPAALTTFPVLS